MTKMLIGGVAALAFAMGIGRFAYTPILPSMQLDLGFGNQTAGIIASANFLGYFLGAFAAGAAAATASRILVFRACLLAGLATTALMAVSENAWIWIALRFLSGLASAGVLVIVSSMVLERAARRGVNGFAGVLFSGVGIGIALSGLGVLLIDPAFGWRGDWLGLAVVSAVLLLPAWFWLTDGERRPEAHEAVAAPRALPWLLVFLVLAYFCEGAGYIVSGTFLVSIVQALPGVSAYGELAWIAVGLAAAPSCLFWARVGERWGLVTAIVAAHLVQAVGILLPLFSASALAVVSAAVLFGGTFMGITTLAISLAGRIAPARRGRAVGLVTAAFGLGQIVGPIVAGAMAERSGSFDLALSASAAVVAFGALLLVVGRSWAAASKPSRTYV